ncbi:selenocysteine lyase/cysteine desulfurase [Seleniivibrio woodruffii]|uniref:Selenocysteine lyase/cysteine desulfurase n=2 Tax=Seleniivibrio woodruffii TaxID=1078050 RepID=A0A4R1KCU2_9BACT|nr:selenocysteine lyase/cysteine desulfurase [Seleniivibrio woodruffii]TVZ34906.1 selenocysteine lyase/cysteine desulfurase [Seleniivibrio woodruffii]
MCELSIYGMHMSINRRESPFRHLIKAHGGFINFDNAATTPPFIAVMKAIDDFSDCYPSVHRGSGRRADHCSGLYEKTRADILDFFGTDSSTHTAIYTRNTTESINRLAELAPRKDKTVIVTEMEHHSNDLPWRQRFAETLHVLTDASGRLDLNHLEALLKNRAGRVAIVSVSGASNVTGFINPIRETAALAHRYGAMICVDAAQLAPHRRIDMKADGIDFLAFSGHKMYAPFGIGGLIGRKDFFSSAEPCMCGGGTVNLVTKDLVTWADPPARFEAGTPNLMGAVALGAALRVLKESGMDRIEAWESALANHIIDRLSQIEGLKLFSRKDGTGVISFNMEGIFHKTLADRLSYEAGIEVRSGCFCAQPYVQKLLGIDPAAISGFSAEEGRPGMVRISPGLYNTYDEADRLCEFLISIRGEVHSG